MFGNGGGGFGFFNNPGPPRRQETWKPNPSNGSWVAPVKEESWKPMNDSWKGTSFEEKVEAQLRLLGTEGGPRMESRRPESPPRFFDSRRSSDLDSRSQDPFGRNGLVPPAVFGGPFVSNAHPAQPNSTFFPPPATFDASSSSAPNFVELRHFPSVDSNRPRFQHEIVNNTSVPFDRSPHPPILDRDIRRSDAPGQNIHRLSPLKPPPLNRDSRYEGVIDHPPTLHARDTGFYGSRVGDNSPRRHEQRGGYFDAHAPNQIGSSERWEPRDTHPPACDSMQGRHSSPPREKSPSRRPRSPAHGRAMSPRRDDQSRSRELFSPGRKEPSAHEERPSIERGRIPPPSDMSSSSKLDPPQQWSSSRSSNGPSDRILAQPEQERHDRRAGLLPTPARERLNFFDLPSNIVEKTSKKSDVSTIRGFKEPNPSYARTLGDNKNMGFFNSLEPVQYITTPNPAPYPSRSDIPAPPVARDESWDQRPRQEVWKDQKPREEFWPAPPSQRREDAWGQDDRRYEYASNEQSMYRDDNPYAQRGFFPGKKRNLDASDPPLRSMMDSREMLEPRKTLVVEDNEVRVHPAFKKRQLDWSDNSQPSRQSGSFPKKMKNEMFNEPHVPQYSGPSALTLGKVKIEREMPRSEDELGLKVDRCFADSLLKVSGGVAIGIVASVAFFKSRSWPVWFGSGVGLGTGWSNCRHDFAAPHVLHGKKVPTGHDSQGKPTYNIVVENKQ